MNTATFIAVFLATAVIFSSFAMTPITSAGEESKKPKPRALMSPGLTGEMYAAAMQKAKQQVLGGDSLVVDKGEAAGILGSYKADRETPPNDIPLKPQPASAPASQGKLHDETAPEGLQPVLAGLPSQGTTGTVLAEVKPMEAQRVAITEVAADTLDKMKESMHLCQADYNGFLKLIECDRDWSNAGNFTKRFNTKREFMGKCLEDRCRTTCVMYGRYRDELAALNCHRESFTEEHKKACRKAQNKRCEENCIGWPVRNILGCVDNFNAVVSCNKKVQCENHEWSSRDFGCRCENCGFAEKFEKLAPYCKAEDGAAAAQ